MSFLAIIDLNGYEILTALICANFIAQIFKTATYAFKNREINLTMLFTTGGMPSSHSSAVTAMACSTGLVEGFSSSLFAISFCIASIVMYDAAGVRRSAGKQARVLNQIIKEFMEPEHILNKDKLKEFLGHTPKEVVSGAVLGIAVSVGLRLLIESSYGI